MDDSIKIDHEEPQSLVEISIGTIALFVHQAAIYLDLARRWKVPSRPLAAFLSFRVHQRLGITYENLDTWDDHAVVNGLARLVAPKSFEHGIEMYFKEIAMKYESSAIIPDEFSATSSSIPQQHQWNDIKPLTTITSAQFAEYIEEFNRRADLLVISMKAPTTGQQNSLLLEIFLTLMQPQSYAHYLRMKHEEDLRQQQEQQKRQLQILRESHPEVLAAKDDEEKEGEGKLAKSSNKKQTSNKGAPSSTSASSSSSSSSSSTASASVLSPSPSPSPSTTISASKVILSLKSLQQEALREWQVIEEAILRGHVFGFLKSNSNRSSSSSSSIAGKTAATTTGGGMLVNHDDDHGHHHRYDNGYDDGYREEADYDEGGAHDDNWSGYERMPHHGNDTYNNNNHHGNNSPPAAGRSLYPTAMDDFAVPTLVAPMPKDYSKYIGGAPYKPLPNRQPFSSSAISASSGMSRLTTATAPTTVYHTQQLPPPAMLPRPMIAPTLQQPPQPQPQPQPPSHHPHPSSRINSSNQQHIPPHSNDDTHSSTWSITSSSPRKRKQQEAAGHHLHPHQPQLSLGETQAAAMAKFRKVVTEIAGGNSSSHSQDKTSRQPQQSTVAPANSICKFISPLIKPRSFRQLYGEVLAEKDLPSPCIKATLYGHHHDRHGQGQGQGKQGQQGEGSKQQSQEDNKQSSQGDSDTAVAMNSSCNSSRDNVLLVHQEGDYNVEKREEEDGGTINKPDDTAMATVEAATASLL